MFRDSDFIEMYKSDTQVRLQLPQKRSYYEFDIHTSVEYVS